MILKNNEKLKKFSMMLASWRSFSAVRLLQYVFMFASVPMLAYGIQPYTASLFILLVCTIIALYSGFFATLLWNDITDVDIDAIAHPNRPLPAGRITKKTMFGVALIFSALTFIFSLFVSIWCLLLVGVAAGFVAVHNKYLRKKIKFPAYSEIFTPVQWVVVPVFGYLAIWSNALIDADHFVYFPLLGSFSYTTTALLTLCILVVFTYFADNAHDLAEGIHDLDGDLKAGVKTYASSFGVQPASVISFLMFCIAGVFGILLFFRTSLTLVFLIPFLSIWVYALYHSFRLVHAKPDEKKMLGKIVGQKTFRFFWVTYDLIFLDLFLQLIILYWF